MRRICVYCGSSPGRRSEHRATAEAMGRTLAERHLELVYGGGRSGLMGVLADACLAGGGRVTGVIPGALVARERGHHGVSDLRIVDSMHERKATMADLSDGFVALPGGLGTLEEIAEALTWSQLGLHRKPCGVVNVGGFFDPLIAWIDGAVDDGYVTDESRRMLVAEEEPAALLDRFAEYEPPRVPRWIDEDEM